MPIDEALGRDHIFTMAFPTLYPTGQADFNMPCIRKVALNNYARHFLCYRDGRFGRHPHWRFFVFNLLMRRKANTAAQFYMSKASGLEDLDREELANTLQADESLLPQIVRQGSSLTGIRPFWRNKSSHLYAQARFLSQYMSPVFITFSNADMQWQDLHRHFPSWSEVSQANDSVWRKFI
jgi:ATP-dependent DNA helicase PIF1